MRAFLDTSTLFKKYLEEPGSDKLADLMDDMSHVVISPITVVEIHAAAKRRLTEKNITRPEYELLLKEFLRDFPHFEVVHYNDNLIRECIRLSGKYSLKSLDLIQLASVSLAKADLFLTSDSQLAENAEKEFKNVTLI